MLISHSVCQFKFKGYYKQKKGISLMVLHVCHVYIMYNAYIVYNVIQDCKNIHEN